MEVVNEKKGLNTVIIIKSNMANEDPQVSHLERQIEKLGRGEPVVIGGIPDIAYLREQIAKLPADTTPGLLAMLDEVNPTLSTWEARKDRPADLKIINKIPKEDYVKRYGVEEGVVDAIGLETLRASKILFSDYWNSGPFFAMLPDTINQSQAEELTRFGYQPVTLGRNEALALFIDGSRVRRVEKLQQDPRYIDQKMVEFMSREAGNHGKFFFVGPPSDYEEELKIVLSPMGVEVYSSFAGIPLNKGAINLMGSVPNGSTAYRKDTTVLVSPPHQKSRSSL